MAKRPNFQAAASRNLSRPQRPGGNASGIGHTPNPIHYVGPPPPLVNHMGFQGISGLPNVGLPQEQPSGGPSISQQQPTDIRSIIEGIQNGAQPGIQPGMGAGPMLPGGVSNNPNIAGQPVANAALPNLDEGSIYNDPQSQLQYRINNGQMYQLSGTDQSTYNGLPYGMSAIAPGQPGYVSPDTPLNQIPGYQSLDAQGNNLNSGPPLGNTDANYDSLKQTILDTQQGKNPGTVPAAAAPVVNVPATPAVSSASSTPNVQQPVVQNSMTPTPPPNVQQFGNRNLPGFMSGHRMGGGFGAVAARMLGRGRL